MKYELNDFSITDSVHFD